MQPRTILGLIFIVAAGVALAWLFRTGGAPNATIIADMPEASPVAGSNHSRGRIVPLMVDEGFKGTAFISAGTSVSSDAPHRDDAASVAVQPTIRRQSPAGPAVAPRLKTSFPRPLGLLGILDTGDGPNDSEEEPPIEKPPQSHIIVDGDTLPALAETYLGNEDRAAEIYQLNHERLPSRELLPIGLELALPQP